MKDFREGIRKAISDLSKAGKRCIDELKNFEEGIGGMDFTIIDTLPGSYVLEKDKSGITTEEVVKAFTDLGETLRKGIIAEPQSDWKILDVNCLPSDILVDGKYEFQFLNLFREWHKADNNMKFSGILKDVEDGFKYRYRPTQTKKTNEELAEEYLKSFHNEDTKLWDSFDIVDAYIAGRESMEGDIDPEIKKIIENRVNESFRKSMENNK